MEKEENKGSKRNTYIEVALGVLTAYMLYKYVAVLWLLSWSFFYIVTGQVTDESSYAVYSTFFYGSFSLVIFAAVISAFIAIRYAFTKRFERFFKYFISISFAVPLIIFVLGYSLSK
jgi:hypothetical protein